MNQIWIPAWPRHLSPKEFGLAGCYANLIACRRIEEGIKRDALLTAQASGGLGGQCQAEAQGRCK